MEYQSIHAPFVGVDAMWRDGQEGEKYADMLIKCAEDCARYEIPIMVTHPYIGFNFDLYFPAEAGINNFGRLINRAENLGIRIGFENVEGEPFLEALINTFASSPAVGFCLDTGHEQCYSRRESNAYALRRAIFASFAKSRLARSASCFNSL